MKKSTKRRSIIWALIIGFLLSMFFFIQRYSKAPDTPRDCNYSYPEAPGTWDKIKESERKFLNSFVQKGGTSNDASCLNETPIYGIIQVKTEQDVFDGLALAKEQNTTLTAAGAQHSMGGHSLARDGIILDMTSFNQVELNEEESIITVQSGATWQQIQRFLDAKGYSVKAMQSINIFTVGGTVSVNAHGIDHTPGPIAKTIRSMKILLSSGEIITASPTKNTELFSHVIGGYGLFGVILEVELEVVPNEAYVRKSVYMPYESFPEAFAKTVEGNDDIGLFYGRLSLSPAKYMTEVALHTYHRKEEDVVLPGLAEKGHSNLNRFVINFSKTGNIGRFIRWVLEKYLEPRVHLCINQNTAMSQLEDGCLVGRNQEMSDSMEYLKNRLKDTDILNEYFVPKDKFKNFIDGLRDAVQENDSNLINVSIRGVEKDDISTLPYATEDMFAFVLYFNQKLNDTESRKLTNTTRDLIDLTTSLGGTFYLPYQLIYSKEQLKASYPNIDAFWETKRLYDPEELFTNKWYEKYGKVHQ